MVEGGLLVWLLDLLVGTWSAVRGCMRPGAAAAAAAAVA